MKKCSEWSQNWFGFWRTSEDSDAVPSIEDFIDASWNPKDKCNLIAYLKDSPSVVAASAGMEKCRFCDKMNAMSSFQSDGIWLWPDDLAHYVESHHVALPVRLVTHIRSRNYLPPTDVENLDNLPWPLNRDSQ